MPQLIDVVAPEVEGTESTLLQWLKNPGEAVAEHEPIAELETDKVTVEVPSPAAGVMGEQLVRASDKLEPGQVLARIATGSEAGADEGGGRGATADAPEAEEALAEAVEVAAEGAAPDTRLSPAARRLLNKYNLDPRLIRGSGRDGRVTHGDIVEYIESHDIAVSDSPKANFQPRPAPQRETRKVEEAEEEVRSRAVKVDPMRRRIANHMVESLLKTAPHVTSVFEADLTAIVADREQRKPALATRGVNLTLTPYFVKAACVAIKAVPEVNSQWLDDSIEIYEDCNIGVGTALEDRGLIVPVIHRAQHLTLEEIARRLGELASKARAGQLEPCDVRGGTFTISNHGVSGSLLAAPIVINQPQSAILGLGKMQKRVVVVEEGGHEAARIRPMCYVTLTIDHRVLDAFQTNRFLTRFVEAIENWQP